MKINVAIVGYGNLGKAVEKELLAKNNINLVCIFSRRDNITSLAGTPILAYSSIDEFAGKIDLLILCSGSQNQMLVDAPTFAQKFNIINTFDTHALVGQEFEKLNRIANKTNHIAIMSCGWDPGLMSVMRACFYSITGTMPTTYWGPGTSLGHSDAVRKITGVKDAISITIPIRQTKKCNFLHKRVVYVVCDKQNQKQIKTQIVSMPNYFAGQPVKVKFVSQEHLNKIKSFEHAGRVVCDGDFLLEFCCQMKSNPEFTAKIVANYVCVFDYIKTKYKCGAYTPLDFSPVDLIDMDRLSIVKKFC